MNAPVRDQLGVEGRGKQLPLPDGDDPTGAQVASQYGDARTGLLHPRCPDKDRAERAFCYVPGQGDETQGSFRAVFIRAPWVEQTGPGVSILGTDLGTGRIVAVRQGKLLATAFHPELTQDRRIHQLFVDIVKDNT